MTAILLDTHVWYWLFADPNRLPDMAVQAVEEADTLTVSAISVYEIARKAKIGKWPGMDESRLAAHIRESEKATIAIMPPTPSIMSIAGFLDWDHRDPWDRLIAATALHARAALVSADPAFDDVKALDRIWS